MSYTDCILVYEACEADCWDLADAWLARLELEAAGMRLMRAADTRDFGPMTVRGV